MTTTRLLTALAASAALVVGAAACGSSSDNSSSSSSGSSSSNSAKVSGTVNGAGSTFAAPVYQQWGSPAQGPGHHASTTRPSARAPASPRSRQGTADFGGSRPGADAGGQDATPRRATAVQIPMFFGAITVSYNAQRRESGLKLDGQTLADIFLGKIKNWNDPAIATLNPGVKLPEHGRSRSSTAPTSRARPRASRRSSSDYSPEWKSKVGADKTVKWPTGTGAKGNDGVAAAVKQTAGAIGYVEQAYALQNDFTSASVKNKSGKFVAPTLDVDDGGRRGPEGPGRPRHHDHQRAGPERLPDHLADVHRSSTRTSARPGIEARATPRRVGAFIDYGLGDGPERASRSSTTRSCRRRS